MAENKETIVEATKTTKAPATKKAAVKKTAPKKVAPKAEEVKVESPKEEKKTVKKSAKKVEEPVKAPAKKVEEVKKPLVTEAKASALNVKITPRKCRLVIDTIRGKDVETAVGILANTGHDKAGRIITKVINSAKANAVNNFNMNEDKLFISEIMCSDSIKMRRFLPRAKGSSSGMVKRYANIYVTVKEKI